MIPRRYLSAILFVVVISTAVIASAEYDIDGPLIIERVELCQEKPKGLNRFVPREKNEYIRGKDNELYIYSEVANCKSIRERERHLISLSMGLDIYYEDGTSVYSQKDVTYTENQNNYMRSNGYIYVKIDLQHLKEGEYKVEMYIRDNNSEKEAFTVTGFRIL